MTSHSDTLSTHCPLCQDLRIERIIPDINKRVYWRCPSCYLIFMDSKMLPDVNKEKVRYDHHQNDSTDPNYIAFISPLIESIKLHINSTMLGVDYGCGPNPVLADLLRDQGYKILHYDPFYFPTLDNLLYDFLTCTEVVEHFHKVDLEWHKLTSIVKSHGHLGIMTHLYDDVNDFYNWYYMRDFTHTAFYHSKTMEYISNHWDLNLSIIKNNRIVIFQKN